MAKAQPHAPHAGVAAGVAAGINLKFLNITSPLGETIVEPFGSGLTFPASGTMPVPTGSHYAYVRVRHFRLAEFTTIPVNPPADAEPGIRNGSTNNWTIEKGRLTLPLGDVDEPYLLFAWNYIYTGSTLATLNSIDLSIFVPKL